MRDFYKKLMKMSVEDAEEIACDYDTTRSTRWQCNSIRRESNTGI